MKHSNLRPSEAKPKDGPPTLGLQKHLIAPTQGDAPRKREDIRHFRPQISSRHASVRQKTCKNCVTKFLKTVLPGLQLIPRTHAIWLSLSHLRQSLPRTTFRL